MNVTKGDKAMIIDGPSAGSIVEVGEYIAPDSFIQFRGERSKVSNEHNHWVRSLGQPLKIYVYQVVQIGTLRKVLKTSMQVDMDVPMADSFLRKLTDIDEPAEEYSNELQTV